jgi:putative hydroxymethylpyrimidine transport system substrate-binding protein
MKKRARSLADAFVAALMIAVATAAVAGCAKKSSEPTGAGTKQVRVILDYLPNAVHVGFYQAQAAGYFRKEGLSVRIDAPTSSSDTLRLMAAGQAEFGLVSLLDFMSVRAKGEPLKIIMAVEQRPLAAMIALKKSGIERPKDLQGRLVGTTGTLSDDAGVKWMVKYDGGDPATVKLINIGFNTAQEVIAGNVDASFGFWSQEGVQVAAHQPATVLRLYDYGVPPYPELIVFAREEFLAKEPETTRKFLRAVTHGYEDAIAKPDAACATMAAQVEGETADSLKPYLAALAPVLQADAPEYGWVNIAVIGEYLGWLKRTGVMDIHEEPSKIATNEFLPVMASGGTAEKP